MICPGVGKIRTPNASGELVKADKEKPPNKRGPDSYRQVVWLTEAGQLVRIKIPPSLPRLKGRTGPAAWRLLFCAMQHNNAKPRIHRAYSPSRPLIRRTDVAALLSHCGPWLIVRHSIDFERAGG